jgi:hypothetical protein
VDIDSTVVDFEGAGAAKRLMGLHPTLLKRKFQIHREYTQANAVT